MGTASARRRRKNKMISNSSSLFSSYLDKNDYNSAGKIVYWTTLKIGGKEGIMNALDNANSFIKRRSLRRGL
ncbi:MAG: hypothetical protein ACTSQP_23090 [Promethearchaeota archaeon]